MWGVFRLKIMYFMSSEWITLENEQDLTNMGIYKGELDIPMKCREIIRERELIPSNYKHVYDFIECVIKTIAVNNGVEYVIFIDAEFDKPYLVLIDSSSKAKVYRFKERITVY